MSGFPIGISVGSMPLLTYFSNALAHMAGGKEAFLKWECLLN